MNEIINHKFPASIMQVENLSVTINHVRLLHNVSFSIKSNSVIALLGHNGAGKSTTIKAIMGLLPYTGSVKILGVDIHSKPQYRYSIISYLSESNPLYEELYIKEYLYLICKIHKVDHDKIQKKIKEAILVCELSAMQYKKIKELSKGYKQRVGIAKAIVRDSQILILDEPTNALDRINICEIRDLIKLLSQSKTIIISTHIMDEIEELCSDVLILKNGRLLHTMSMEYIKNILCKPSIIIETSSELASDFFEDIVPNCSLENLGMNSYKLCGNISEDAFIKISRKAFEKSILITKLFLERAKFGDTIKHLLSA